MELVDTPPTASAFWRALIGGLVLSAWVGLRGIPLLPPARACLGLAAAGTCLALDLTLWHQSIVLVGPGLATLLANFQVFFMALAGSMLLRERLGGAILIAIPLALVGLALVVGLDWSSLNDNAQSGVLFGLLAAVAYTGFVLTMRWVQANEIQRPASANLAIASLCTAAVLGLFIAFTGESLRPSSVTDAAWLTAYGLGSQVIAWVLITGSLTQVPASRVGLLLLAQPVLSFVWDVLFFSRHFTPIEVTGAMIAIAAIYLGSRPAPVPLQRTTTCER